MSNTEIKNGLVIYDNGDKYWYKDNLLHRNNGLPAVEHTNGHKEWYINGELHREDGPAVEWTDGSKAWWIDGKRHREDGPAIENRDGDKYWFIREEQLSQEAFNHYIDMKKLNEQLHQELAITNKSNIKPPKI